MKKAYYFHGNIIKFLFKKHYCPWCDNLLSKKLNHKIVNSNSEEAKKYKSLYSSTDGGSIIGNFDSDIRHHLFYCGSCDKEIEHKTLFSYEKVMAKISQIIELARSKNKDLHILYYDEYEKIVNLEDKIFFNKAVIAFKMNGSYVERVCFIALKNQNYEQAVYYKSTDHLKDIIKILRQE